VITDTSEVSMGIVRKWLYNRNAAEINVQQQRKRKEKKGRWFPKVRRR